MAASSMMVLGAEQVPLVVGFLLQQNPPEHSDSERRMNAPFS
jgi:hypothetical protein